MNAPRSRMASSIGKKLLNGFTGILLLGFIVAHLAGNLTIFVGRDALNGYAATTHSLGPLLIVIELLLGLVFLLHAGSAIRVWLDGRAARQARNTRYATKGGASKQTLASRSMIWTGLALLVFLVVHLWQFRFGPTEAQGYVAPLGNREVWDLWRVVVEVFKQPGWVLFYTVVMALLGLHLRHGFWSAFQSIGLLGPGLRPIAYSAGLAFAVIVAAGFLALPAYVYLFVPAPTPGVAMVHP